MKRTPAREGYRVVVAVYAGCRCNLKGSGFSSDEGARYVRSSKRILKEVMIENIAEVLVPKEAAAE